MLRVMRIETVYSFDSTILKLSATDVRTAKNSEMINKGRTQRKPSSKGP